jgi:aryl-alcohol dehydrogenase-like predicted oxidoreductase
VTVGSKWGYMYTAGWSVNASVHEVKEHSLDVLRRQWQETRHYLGPYLRLYQIHSATLESGVFDNSTVLDELAAIKSQGMCIGLSVSGACQLEALERAAAIRLDGVRLFDAVQITWNLLEPSCTQTLGDVWADGMGIIVKEALANGRLTPRNNDQAFMRKRQLLEQQAVRLNTTPDALAIAAALAQPWADVVLSGAATVSQLHSNVRALEVRWDEEATSALAALAEPPEVYWYVRKTLAWN